MTKHLDSRADHQLRDVRSPATASQWQSHLLKRPHSARKDGCRSGGDGHGAVRLERDPPIRSRNTTTRSEIENLAAAGGGLDEWLLAGRQVPPARHAAERVRADDGADRQLLLGHGRKRRRGHGQGRRPGHHHSEARPGHRAESDHHCQRRRRVDSFGDRDLDEPVRAAHYQQPAPDRRPAAGTAKAPSCRVRSGTRRRRQWIRSPTPQRSRPGRSANRNPYRWDVQGSSSCGRGPYAARICRSVSSRGR